MVSKCYLPLLSPSSLPLSPSSPSIPPLPPSSPSLPPHLLPQEYLARKKQKLQKRLADQLRSSAQSGQVKGVFGQATDLEQLLKSFTGVCV